MAEESVFDFDFLFFVFPFPANFRNGSGAHPASYPVQIICSLPEGKAVGA
jgi:hypothetical protein